MRAVVCLVAGLMVASCGSETTGSFESEDGEYGSYSVDKQGGETVARITTDDGTAEMRSGTNVPVDLPAGFTIYPGAKVVSNTTFSRNETKGALVVLESADAPQKLADYYRKQAEAAGIAIELELSVDGGKMIGGQGKDGHSFSFNANRDGKSTSAQLMVGHKLGD